MHFILKRALFQFKKKKHHKQNMKKKERINCHQHQAGEYASPRTGKHLRALFI
jgi:hypothetical protein